MAADPRDLCTVAQVRAARQTVASDTSQDVLVQDYITDASVLLMAEFEQEWAPTTASAARVFEYPWRGEILDLAPYALRTVTSVVVDSDQGAGITISTDEWRLEPKPPKDAVYTAIRLRPFSAALGKNVWRDREVTITGAWGYATIPLEAKRAGVLTVIHWLNINTATVAFDDDTMDSYQPPKRGIPNEAREMLRRFKRGTVYVA